MKTNKLFFLLIVLMFFCKINSQDSAFYFSSVVLNSSSGLPVSNARISLVGTLRQTFTNESGAFLILVSKKKAVLEISKPFFHSVFFSTPFLIRPDNKLLLNPYPSEKTDDLYIKDSTEKKIFSEDEWMLRDYTLYNKNILLILKNRKSQKEKLRVLSSSSEIMLEITLPEKSNCFFRDYRGSYSILTEDKARQFVFDGRGIIFTAEFPIREFEKYFCFYLAEDSANVYFRYNSPNAYYLDQDLRVKIKVPALTYYAVNKKTKQKSLLKNIPNEAVEKGEYGDFLFLDLGLKRLPFNGTGTIFQEIKGPLFRTGKGIVFFDAGNNKIENYDLEGKLKTISNFSFYPGRIWDENFYLDRVTDKFYTFFTSEVTPACSVLKEINPETGSAGAVTKIPEEFIFDLKANNGVVYFLKREISGNISLMQMAVKK